MDAALQATRPCDAFQDVSTQTSDQLVSSLYLDVAVQTSSHGIHTSSLDAAVQTIPHSTLSQHVSTQMGSRSASSFSADVLAQTPIRSTVLHDVATQLLLAEFFFGCIFSNDLLDRQNFDRQSPPSVQDDIGGDSPSLTCTLTRSSLDCDDLVRTLAPRACCSHRRDSNSLPRLQASLLMLTCALHMAYLLQRDLYDPGYVQRFQSRTHSSLLVPSMWEHVMHDQLLLVSEVLVLLWREPTILLKQILVQGLGLFLNHGHWFFPWSNLGNPSLTGLVTLTQSTAISCIINSVFPFFNGTQARRAEILPTLSPLPVESSMRLFFKKPVIMFRTSPISSWRTLATRTSLSCSTRKPLSLTQKFSHSRPTLRAKVLGVWSCSLFEASWDVPLSPVHRLLLFCSVHIHNVVAKKRDASTELLQFLHAKMREYNVDFIGVDFNMSAFSTVGDVFTDDEFSAPGNSLLWGLGAVEDPIVNVLGFLIMPKRPSEWRVHSFTWLP